jgi:GR25 family glycosyltransferase involved in LPS biosynthesis
VQELTVVPCVHEGVVRTDYDNAALHLQHRREWKECDHPSKPHGDVVCARSGCNPLCVAYEADESRRSEVLGVPPLTTRRMYLDHARAFNGSIYKDHITGDWLLAYRDQQANSRIFITRLDDQMRPGAVTAVELDHPRCALSQEDPRLFFVGDFRIGLSFTGVETCSPEYHPSKIKANVLFALLDPDSLQPRTISAPEVPDRATWEKNWQFFTHDGRLYFIYSIKPHVVYEVHEITGKILHSHITETPHAWAGGHLRGGAPPVRVGDRYYHWFHGRVGNYDETTYNTGVYTFAARPPFEVLEMTRAPVQWADPFTRVGQGAAVIFVGGAVHEPLGRQWVISQGVNDRAIDVLTYSDRDIKDAMHKPKCKSELRTAPIYVLYCEEIPERRDRIAGHLKSRGIAAERIHWWRSIHGKTWGLMTNKVYKEGTGAGESPINSGQVGLILGHYTLWQHLHAIGCEEAIILEDDAVLCEDFDQRYDEITTHLPADAQLCYIGHLGDVQPKIKDVLPGNLARLSFVPWGTHGYMVRKSALPILLERMARAQNPVDSQIWYECLEGGHLKWYSAVETLVSQLSAQGIQPTTLSGFGEWQIHPEPLRSLLNACADLPGWCVLEKRRLLASLVYREKPKVIVEVGVFGGSSLIPMAHALRQNLRDQPEGADHRGMIYGIDPWDSTAAENYATAGEQQNSAWWANVNMLDIYVGLCQRVTNDNLWPFVSLLKGHSDDLAPNFDEIDILHIDGNHDRHSVRKDVQAYVPRVVDGGYVIMDDTQWSDQYGPTVETALRLIESMGGRCVVDAPGMGGGVRAYRIER